MTLDTSHDERTFRTDSTLVHRRLRPPADRRHFVWHTDGPTSHSKCGSTGCRRCCGHARQCVGRRGVSVSDDRENVRRIWMNCAYLCIISHTIPPLKNCIWLTAGGSRVDGASLRNINFFSCPPPIPATFADFLPSRFRTSSSMFVSCVAEPVCFILSCRLWKSGWVSHQWKWYGIFNEHEHSTSSEPKYGRAGCPLCESRDERSSVAGPDTSWRCGPILLWLLSECSCCRRRRVQHRSLRRWIEWASPSPHGRRPAMTWTPFVRVDEVCDDFGIICVAIDCTRRFALFTKLSVNWKVRSANALILCMRHYFYFVLWLLLFTLYFAKVMHTAPVFCVLFRIWNWKFCIRCSVSQKLRSVLYSAILCQYFKIAWFSMENRSETTTDLHFITKAALKQTWSSSSLVFHKLQAAKRIRCRENWVLRSKYLQKFTKIRQKWTEMWSSYPSNVGAELRKFCCSAPSPFLRFCIRCSAERRRI